MPLLEPATSARLVRARRTCRRAVLRRRRLLAALLTAVAVATGLSAVAAPPPASVEVLVAARDLPAGTRLASGDLVAADYRPGTAPEAALGVDAQGRVLASALRRGEPVTDVRLVGPGLVASDDGLVALPVRLPDAGMAGLLEVGDRIDLLAVDPAESGAPSEASEAPDGGFAAPVADDVPVLALPVADADPVGGASPGGRLVVLGAQPDEVSPITTAAVTSLVTFAWSPR